MWGDKETVVAGSLAGVDVTGWLIMDDSCCFRLTHGCAGAHVIADGSHWTVFRGGHAGPFLRRSEHAIHVIKPFTPPPPEVREVTREVVREMTDEEVLARAEDVLLVRFGNSPDGTYEEVFWDAAYESMRCVNRAVENSLTRGAEPPPPVVTPPKVMKVGELLPGDEIAIWGGVRVFEKFHDDGDLLFRNKRYGRNDEYEMMFAHGVPVYRTINGVRTLISGWPIGVPTPAETKGGE